MIQPVGYLKLWREIGTKPIWKNSSAEHKAVLITLLMMVNFKPNEWEWKGMKYTATKGQIITSLDSIVKECGRGVTTQNVRSALKRFEKLGFLTNESTKTGRLITIVNWDIYQSDEKNQQSYQQRGNKEVTKSQQRGNKEVTTKEEGNKDNKENKDKNIDAHKEVYAHYLSLDLIKHKSLTNDMIKAMDKAKKELKVNTEEMKKMLDRYKEKYELSKNSKFPIKKRPLAEFFGQKKYGGVSLICSDYLEENYRKSFVVGEDESTIRKVADF